MTDDQIQWNASNICLSRHEWYQSDDYVTIEVFAKQLRREDVDVTVEQQTVRHGCIYITVYNNS
jgi:hypothetical protein